MPRSNCLQHCQLASSRVPVVLPVHVKNTLTDFGFYCCCCCCQHQHKHRLLFGLGLCVLDDFVLLMVATCNLAFCVIARGVLPLRADFVSFRFVWVSFPSFFSFFFSSFTLYLLWPAFSPQEAKENAWLRVLISSATPHTIFHLQQERNL